MKTVLLIMLRDIMKYTLPVTPFVMIFFTLTLLILATVMEFFIIAGCLGRGWTFQPPNRQELLSRWYFSVTLFSSVIVWRRASTHLYRHGGKKRTRRYDIDGPMSPFKQTNLIFQLDYGTPSFKERSKKQLREGTLEVLIIMESNAKQALPRQLTINR